MEVNNTSGGKEDRLLKGQKNKRCCMNLNSKVDVGPLL